MLDRVAWELGKDSTLVKEMNLTKDGDLLHVGELRVEGAVALRECWEECKKLGKYAEKRAEVAAFNALEKSVKRGVSMTAIKFGPNPSKVGCQASALVRVYLDGSVLLSHGGIEMGQGLHTKMIQVASR